MITKIGSDTNTRYSRGWNDAGETVAYFHTMYIDIPFASEDLANQEIDWLVRHGWRKYRFVVRTRDDSGTVYLRILK
jgi:hypothetical protein